MVLFEFNLQDLSGVFAFQSLQHRAQRQDLTGLHRLESAFVIAVVAGASGRAAMAPTAGELSYNEHIQPILSEYCYHCHGPDAGTRKPEKEPLRLDIEADAFAIRDFGAPVIIKGKPAESELIHLINADLFTCGAKIAGFLLQKAAKPDACLVA